MGHRGAWAATLTGAVLLWNLALPARGATFVLTSAAFANDGPIPALDTCEGRDLSPALQWAGAPANTRSYALLVVDPDAPGGEFAHWVVYDLPAASTGLPQGLSKSPELPTGGRQGINGFRRTGYGGPCPPPGPVHHYVFTLHALDIARLPVPPGAPLDQVRAAIRGHVLATATLTGVFNR